MSNQSITVGGKKVLHPEGLIEYAQRNGTPTDFIGKANSIYCPLGKESGRAWLLLEYADAKSIHTSALASTLFTIEWKYNGQTISFPKYSLINAVCMTQSHDASGIYLCEFADQRHLASMATVSKRYNVRKPASVDDSGADLYYTSTLNEGSLWTWQTMLTDLWSNVTSFLGNASTLPYTPGGTPENFEFVGMSAWDAIHALLEHVSVTTVYNPFTGAITFVQTGDSSAQSGLSEALEKLKPLHDFRPLVNLEMHIPSLIDVHFWKVRETWDSNIGAIDDEYPAHVITKGTSGGDSYEGTSVPVWDNMLAVIDSEGSLTNSSALETRATEVASKWTNATRHARQLNHRAYIGIHNTVTLGREVGAVRWRDTGEGPVTEVIQRPAVEMTNRKWAPQTQISYGKLYRFTLNENMGASTSNQAGADILELDGTDTEIDAPVRDPLGLFTDLENNAAGFCILQNEKYYVVAPGDLPSSAAVIWQFTLVGDMGASTTNQGTATKLNPDGTTTGETITIIDGSPNSIFSVLTNGSSGWVFEVDGSYYIIQAECADGGGSVTIENLNDINDVVITSAATGEILALSGANWINRTLAEAGIVGTADTSLAGTGFFEDDDTLASDSALKVASVQSIRAYIATQLANLVDSAPGALDTLNELAAALGDDPDFATTITTSLAAKAAIADVVANNLFDANTLIKADSDNTPTALTVGLSTIIGRLSTGGIAALTPAQVRTLLGLVIGTNVQAQNAELDAIAAGNSGSGNVSTSPTNYTAAGPTLDEHLTGIDTALGSVSGGGGIDGGSAASVYLPSQVRDFGGA